MKRIKHINIILTFLLALSSISLLSQSTRKLVREGNSQYDDGNFTDAEVQYRKALTDNPNYFKGKFNLGDAMYSQENYEESGKIFNELAERALESEQKSSVYYNLGNNFLSAQKYQEAIEAYKRSLRLNPDDYDAKYNLEYARKKLSEQQQQQQNQDQDQQKDQDKQDQQNKDQNKDDQQKDQEQKEQDQKDQQDKQDQDKNEQSDQQKQQPQPQQISKEDAQKMLDALKNDEKKTLQELQKQKAKTTKGSKSEIDW